MDPFSPFHPREHVYTAVDLGTMRATRTNYYFGDVTIYFPCVTLFWRKRVRERVREREKGRKQTLKTENKGRGRKEDEYKKNMGQLDRAIRVVVTRLAIIKRERKR